MSDPVGLIVPEAGMMLPPHMIIERLKEELAEKDRIVAELGQRAADLYNANVALTRALRAKEGANGSVAQTRKERRAMERREVKLARRAEREGTDVDVEQILKTAAQDAHDAIERASA